MSKLQIPEWEKRERTVVCEETEELQTASPVKAVACEVACGMHLLAAMAATCIFVNTGYFLPLLVFILYCIFGAFWFGSAASSFGGENEEE